MKFHHLCVIFRITNIISNRLDMSKIQQNVSMIINHQNPTSCDPKRDSLCPHLISDVSVNTTLVFGVLSLIPSDCLIADIISY